MREIDTPFIAYQEMMKYELPGIPVVDTSDKFLGISTKEVIVESLVSQLLKQAKEPEEKK